MFKTATLAKTGKDNKNSRGIEVVSELKNLCKINGKPYRIRMIVKKQPDRRFAYYYGAIDIRFI